MSTIYKRPLALESQPEGGYTVTCPLMSELITERDLVQEPLANVNDALLDSNENLTDMGRPLPPVLHLTGDDTPIWLETAIAIP